MLQVMIVRDGGATKIPKQVADMDEVERLRAAGHVVEVLEPAATAPTEPARPAPACAFPGASAAAWCVSIPPKPMTVS